MTTTHADSVPAAVAPSDPVPDRTAPDDLGAAEAVACEHPRLGRRRDHTRDAEILEATIDVLAEHGYDGTTVDLVAARAKAGKATLYRRWPSKEHLVVDAVACLKNRHLDQLPDTGTLRGDLMSIALPASFDGSERKLRVMAGLMSVMHTSPELASLVEETILRPREVVVRSMLQRAVDRGEIAADLDLDLIASLGTALAVYQHLLRRSPLDGSFFVRLVDHVVLPAVGLEPGAPVG